MPRHVEVLLAADGDPTRFDSPPYSLFLLFVTCLQVIHMTCASQGQLGLKSLVQLHLLECCSVCVKPLCSHHPLTGTGGNPLLSLTIITLHYTQTDTTTSLEYILFNLRIKNMTIYSTRFWFSQYFIISQKYNILRSL